MNPDPISGYMPLMKEVTKKRFIQGMKKLSWTALVILITTLINHWINDTSPKIVVRHYYNTVEATEVPRQVGDLVLDYQQTDPSGKGVYLIEVANEGRGTEKDLRLHAKFPDGLNPAFAEAPDFRIYKPVEVLLEGDEFFMELNGFPKKARAEIVFLPPPTRELLCDIQIKVVGENGEGRVEGIRGVSCD